MIEVTVHSRWLKALSTIVAKETKRYAIQGVLIERKAGRLKLVATDGKRLMEIDAGESSGAETRFILNTLTIKELNIKKNSPAVQFSVGGLYQGTCPLVVQMGGMKLDAESVEGNFPPYEDVIPQGNGLLEGAVGFGPALLAGVCKAFEVAVPFKVNNETLAVRMRAYGPNKAVKFEQECPDSGATITAVLMPMLLRD